MTTPRDDIAGMRKWNDEWPHWKFTEHQHDALRFVLDYSAEAADAIDALQARVKELEEQRDEARKASNLGCDARDGGAHSIMVQGSYKFCTGCGSTIRTPTLQERARAAESRVKVFEVELNGAIERSKMLLDAKIHWMDRALRAEQERADEWTRRREAESQRDVAKAAADTLRQERDEAYGRAAAEAELHPDGSNSDAIAAAIRRLAGPEKEGE